MRPAAVMDLVTDLNASEISDLQARLQQLASDCSVDSEVTLWASQSFATGGSPSGQHRNPHGSQNSG